MASGRLPVLTLRSTEPAHIAQCIKEALRQLQERGGVRRHLLLICDDAALSAHPKILARELGEFACHVNSIPEPIAPAEKPRLFVINRPPTITEQLRLRKSLGIAKATTVVLYQTAVPDWSPATDIVIREIVWPFHVSVRPTSSRPAPHDQPEI